MSRVYNFSAGPATLPEDVLNKAQQELLNWHSCGMSIMEVSHRGKEFTVVAGEAEADFRELLNVPDNYKVLFLQGGGRSQFSMVPLNLLGDKKTADYINTGIWSGLAMDEGARYCKVNVPTSSEANKFTSIAKPDQWKLNPDAAYVHYVGNETINGLEFHDIPETGDVPLVCDMSSNILSRPFDVSRYGVIYAGAQKNIGPSGLTIVIIRDDLLGKANDCTPTMFNYKVHADSRSLYNTAPTFPWYMAGLSFKWMKEQGGMAKIAERNQRKASKLYDFLDNSKFYKNPIDLAYRSRMNIVFTLADDKYNEQFLTESHAEGLANLKGHRTVGGMRASIYNAMPEAGVDKLIDFMDKFSAKI